MQQHDPDLRCMQPRWEWNQDHLIIDITLIFVFCVPNIWLTILIL